MLHEELTDGKAYVSEASDSNSYIAKLKGCPLLAKSLYIFYLF